MKNKRIRPTKEQWHELNRLLDDVVKIGHENEIDCDCKVCMKLMNFSKKQGLRERGIHIKNSEWFVARNKEKEIRHKKDSVKIAVLASQGLTSKQIAKKINRSPSYIYEVIDEYDIEVKKIKKGRPRKTK